MSRPKSIRVLIADDNRTVRRGLRLRLENAGGITVIGEAATGTDAVTIAHAERADVVLMDLHMPGMDGLAATRALLGAHSPQRPRVIMITSDASDAFVIDAFEAGVTGYLLKTHETAHLIEIVRGAVSGQVMISPRMTPRLLDELARLRPVAPDRLAVARLTEAELRVVSQLGSGMTSNDDIASHLGISVNTVKTHVGSALRKLELDDRTQLALWAVRNGVAHLGA